MWSAALAGDTLDSPYAEALLSHQGFGYFREVVLI
jgi:hypothetical protein